MTLTREQLEEENLKMREDLREILLRSNNLLNKYPENDDVGQIHAFAAIQNVPHTDQLAKQREADLKVIEAAKNVQCSCELASRLSGHNIDCTTWPMYEALDERERVYKGEI